MKKLILALVAVAFIATTVFSAFAADPKEAFTIDYLQNKKPPVDFPHKKHSSDFGVTCKECHHTMKTDDETPKACGTCHVKGATTAVEGSGDAVDPCHNEKCTKNIFHDKCTSCHKEKDKGPKKCKGCHPK